MTVLPATKEDLTLTPVMKRILERLAEEDAGIGDPTLLPPQEARELAEQTNERWNQKLPEVEKVTSFSIPSKAGASIPCFLFSPENAQGLIVFIHGGGWALCSSATHERAARLLALEARAHVLAFDYRLAPEAAYPSALEDCQAVWEAVVAGVPELSNCDGPAAVAGDSAGANLALALMLSLQGGAVPQPDCGLLFYGVYGADFETASYLGQRDGPGLTRDKMMRYWDWYVPDPVDRKSCMVAPLEASDLQLKSLPPLFLTAAAIDPLRSDTEIMVRRLSSLGRTDRYILYPGVVHGFMQMSLELPEACLAAADAGRAFRELTRP
ncbi:alpha/beta hydrolase [Roseibium sp.]|uniref:alpha/beta hydrolase n=1 Tax=Roseibium sp. TaxID=1936156 RepID=UPI003BAD76E9